MNSPTNSNAEDYYPIAEHAFNSVVGRMKLSADNATDNSVLDTFAILAANIKPGDLDEDLRRILGKYPDVVKRLALDHFVIT